MDIWGEDRPDMYIKILGGVILEEPCPPEDIVDCLVPNGIPCSMKNVEFIEGLLEKVDNEMNSTPDCNIEELIAKYQAMMMDVPDVCFGDKIEFKKYNPKSSTVGRKIKS